MRRYFLPALFLAFSAVVHADTFTFIATGIGSSLAASGTLTGSPDPGDPSAFDITSASAIVNGIVSTLVTPGGTVGNPVSVNFNNGHSYPGYTYDNVIFTTGPSLDDDGLLFSTGGDHSNFYYNNGVYYYTNDETAGGDPIDFSLTDVSTPEPSTFALLGITLSGAGLLRRGLRRNRVLS